MKNTLKKIPRNPLRVVDIPPLLAIKAYQLTLSFDHGLPGKLMPGYRICRHFPSCSAYTYEAIDKYGILKGGVLGAKRIISCNPSTPPNTYDPVP